MEQTELEPEQMPQEVVMYLDRFDHVPPADVLSYYHDLHSGLVMHDALKTRLYGYFTQAMALYPQRSQYTNPGGATEIYSAFATSEDAIDTLSMLSNIAHLWEWEPRGATKVVKLCLQRSIKTQVDQKVYDLSYESAQQALQNESWTEDDSDALGYLAIARIRRELPPPGDGV